jgi:uncharacterized membrane protein
MLSRELIARAGVAGLLALTSHAAHAQSGGRFFSLDESSGGSFSQSAGYAVSGDGNVVVGSAGFGYGSDALHWTYPDGIVTAGLYNAFATGTSLDGSVASVNLDGFRALVWTDAATITDLPFWDDGQSVVAKAVSSDGRVIVGFGSVGTLGDTEMFRWEAAMLPDFTVARQLDATNEDLLSGYYSEGYGVSRDGNAMVGVSYAEDGTARAAKNVGGVWSYLPDLTTSSSFAFLRANAVAANSDGSIMAGWSFEDDGSQRPVRWTSLGVQALTTEFQGEAKAIDAEGNVIVGRYIPDAERAFVWINGQGFFDMQEYLTTVGNFNFCGRRLADATGISDDGLVITGSIVDEITFNNSAFALDLRNGPRCPSDVTQDGVVDFGDFLAFFNYYDSEDCRGDIPPFDQSVDFGDFLAFFNGYDAGC